MAQTLYYNGTILTMEDRCPQVEAVLTEDGRILETGTWEKVKERAGDKARRLDLQGRVMMPGFIDSHSHFTACASHTMEVDLGGAGSFEDMITCIRQYIEDKKIPEGKWVTASGYDHNRLKEHSHPRRKVLDQAAPQNPLILKHQSGHMGVFNTMALNLLGVTGQTQAPQGGVIEMEAGFPPDIWRKMHFWASRDASPCRRQKISYCLRPRPGALCFLWNHHGPGGTDGKPAGAAVPDAAEIRAFKAGFNFLYGYTGQRCCTDGI